MFVLPPGANIGQIWASFRLLFCWLPSHESDSGGESKEVEVVES